VKIIKKKLSSLKEWARNPRRISNEALKGLRKSIDRFGLVEPIIWNKRTGHVVGGHQRLKVLRERGDAETDVVVIELDQKQESALNISLNNPAIAGEFSDDLEQLLAEVKQFSKKDFDDLRLDKLELPAGRKDAAGPKLGDLKYHILVDCSDEADQVKRIEEFEAKGLKCRALIL